ncbi:MAG: sulfur carrier protein ThiS [Deltaproteobacteria bacterium]|jgi:thiamine biosynthesis protein ThiS|nr:sulfur carrier protein ThiS [Deltaproteobacteria bacterium]
MNIILNGKTEKVDENISIFNLLENFSNKKAVVVELNGNICQNKDYKLKESDKVEIVTFVGGG